MRFDSYHYIPALRPQNPIDPAFLPFWQKTKKWWAQVKKNGTCSIIYVPPASEGRPFARTRHGDEDHKAWQFTEGSIKPFETIQNDKWHVFSAELMHSKGEGVRDTNYVHDVVVYNGVHLLGKTFSHRHSLLRSIFRAKDQVGPDSHWVVDPHLWVAKCHRANFKRLFNSLDSKLDEGLVLKDPCSVLSVTGNDKWMVKCRRPHENYRC